MGSPLTESATYTSTVNGIDDGDTASGTNFTSPIQALANRTKYLKGELDNGTKLLRVVADLASLKALTGMSNGEIRQVITSGRIYLYSSTATGTSDDWLKVTPTSASGRWLLANVERPVSVALANDEEAGSNVTADISSGSAVDFGPQVSVALLPGDKVILSAMTRVKPNGSTWGTRVTITETHDAVQSLIYHCQAYHPGADGEERSYAISGVFTAADAATHVFRMQAVRTGSGSGTAKVLSPWNINALVVRPLRAAPGEGERHVAAPGHAVERGSDPLRRAREVSRLGGAELRAVGRVQRRQGRFGAGNAWTRHRGRLGPALLLAGLALVAAGAARSRGPSGLTSLGARRTAGASRSPALARGAASRARGSGRTAPGLPGRLGASGARASDPGACGARRARHARARARVAGAPGGARGRGRPTDAAAGDEEHEHEGAAHAGRLPPRHPKGKPMGIISELLAGVRSIGKTGSPTLTGAVSVAGDGVTQSGQVLTISGAAKTIAGGPVGVSRAAAGNYLKFDGTNWVPAALSTTNYADVLPDLTARVTSASIVRNNGGGYTTGTEFRIYRAMAVVGARFWWKTNGGSAEDVKVTVRVKGSGSSLGTKTIAADSGTNIVEVTFDTPIDLSSHLNEDLNIGMFEVANSAHVYSSATDPVSSSYVWNGIAADWRQIARYNAGGGDGNPNANFGAAIPIVPIFGAV